MQSSNPVNAKGKFRQTVTDRIPTIGISLFVGLYLYASMLYPGGSQADKYSEGYDWVNNYWCNLTSKTAINGQPNPARPFSILAMIILCLALMVFFVKFARIYSKNQLWKRIITVCGVLSMLFATFVFTNYHNLMTTLSSIFGLFVVIGIITEIYKGNLSKYKTSGAFCIVLLGLNNYIYYTRDFIEVLPLLQKITFAAVLIWIAGLNQELIKIETVQLFPAENSLQ